MAEAPKLNVLVVDDDESMRSLLERYLSSAGYRVTLCEDAIGAGHQVLNSPPDVIILDVNMPYMNGIEFANALVMDTSLPSVPIIFITSEERYGPRAELLGADFIVKPIAKARLLESVARVTNASRGNRPA